LKPSSKNFSNSSVSAKSPNPKRSLSADQRLELVKALRAMVSKEIRFGIREDCRGELEAQWLELLEKFFG
jgi:hypothetical protein